MNSRFHVALLALFPLLLFAAIMAAAQLKPISIKGDMLAILGDNSAHDEQSTSVEFYQAQQALLTQQQSSLVFSLAGDGAQHAYLDLATALDQLDIKVQEHQGDLQQIIDFYAPYQGALMSQAYRQALANPNTFNDYFTRQLTQTSSPWLSKSVGEDPSLATFSFVSTLGSAQALTLVDGKLQARDASGETVWMMIATSSIHGDSINGSIALSEAIVAAISRISEQYPNLELRYSGVLFHNAENALQAKWEMNRFGLISVILLATFVAIFLRGLAPLWISSLTVLSAILAGVLALWIVRSEIHILTLVFATTLIGVAIDYAFHAMAHSGAKSKGYSPALKRGLLLALSSTSIGYLCFLTAPMTLLQDVAIFVVGGLLGAWVFVRFCLPTTRIAVVLRPNIDTMAFHAIALQHSARRYANALGAVILLLCVCVWVITPPKLNDSIASFNASSETLMAAQIAHQDYLSGGVQSHRVIVEGDDIQDLLANEEMLSDWVSSKGANTYGISSLLPSEQRQKASLTLYEQAVKTNVFASITQFTGTRITTQNPRLLSYDNFLTGPLADTLPLPIHLQGKEFSLVNVVDVDTTIVEQACAQLQICAVVDVPKQLSKILAHFHSSIHWALLAALTAIFVIFVVSFGLISGAKMSAWLALTALFIVTIISVFAPISVFHTLGLILVLALAVDYFIFYRQGGYSGETFAAISLSALSSLAVFAMLIFSKTPAISQFGAAVLVGLVVVYILAPFSIENKNE
ncbi:MMPL family transporter [Pseudoalteromonas sp. GB56]